MFTLTSVPLLRKLSRPEAPPVTAARKVKLGVVQADAKPMHISELINDVTREKFFLSPPLPNGGGFSKRRVAVDTRHRAFAVKEVFLANAKAHHKRATTRQELLHERASLMQANSPLAFIETLEENDKVYCLMPLLNGDLFDVVVSNAWRERDAQLLALQVMAQVGHQLRRAHQRGIVHEDVKLENILWQKNAKLLLADYGAARDLAHDPPDAKPTFTAQYAAPERLGKADCGTAVDVWSLGVVLLQILTRGKHPLALKEPGSAKTGEGRDAEQIMRRKQQTLANWQQFSTKEPFVQGFYVRFRLDNPKTADFIMRRMLNVEPTRRATARQVAEFARKHMPVGGRFLTRGFLRRASGHGSGNINTALAARAVDILNHVVDHDLEPK